MPNSLPALRGRRRPAERRGQPQIALDCVRVDLRLVKFLVATRAGLAATAACRGGGSRVRLQDAPVLYLAQILLAGAAGELERDSRLGFFQLEAFGFHRKLDSAATPKRMHLLLSYDKSRYKRFKRFRNQI